MKRKCADDDGETFEKQEHSHTSISSKLTQFVEDEKTIEKVLTKTSATFCVKMILSLSLLLFFIRSASFRIQREFWRRETQETNKQTNERTNVEFQLIGRFFRQSERRLLF